MKDKDTKMLIEAYGKIKPNTFYHSIIRSRFPLEEPHLDSHPIIRNLYIEVRSDGTGIIYPVSTYEDRPFSDYNVSIDQLTHYLAKDNQLVDVKPMSKDQFMREIAQAKIALGKANIR